MLTLSDYFVKKKEIMEEIKPEQNGFKPAY